MSETNRFLLVGNASYSNRGCEAIVRGTMETLRQEFGDHIHADAGVYGEPDVVEKQIRDEADPAVHTFRLSAGFSRWSPPWFLAQANKRLGTRFDVLHRPLRARLRGVDAVLELGGDNYSLDYEPPRHLIAMDRYIQAQGTPVVIWGASIGTFDKDPEFAAEMFEHLRSLTAIFVRETHTLAHLEKNGVSENVRLVADPAFVMGPTPVSSERLGFQMPRGAIGINFSPFVAKYLLRRKVPLWKLTRDDIEPWLSFATQLVDALSREFRMPVVLIPHASSDIPNTPGTDDHLVLEEVARRLTGTAASPVHCLPRGLNAREVKWVIAQCRVFAGARTHSTIAALSSGVPTLSIAYSMKARGINEDIFGSLDHLLESSRLDAGEFVGRIGKLITEERRLRDVLRAQIPVMRERALQAGSLLRECLDLPPRQPGLAQRRA